MQEIYYSIVKTPLRLSEPASMDVSEQCFLQLAQTCGTQRALVLPSEQGALKVVRIVQYGSPVNKGTVGKNAVRR